MARHVETKTITRVTRIGQREGHPRYEVAFSDGTSAKTMPSAQVNYGISNSEYREGPVQVVFAGIQIVGITCADGSSPLGAV